MAEKNRLTAADAQLVEETFRERLAALAVSMAEESQSSGGAQPQRGRRRPRKRQTSKAVNKSALVLPEPRRIRDREHVRFVARQSCLVCGRAPSDAHHLRFAQSRALARKVSDEFTVPLCRGHHREVHRCGDEAAWWQKVGINPARAARNLWLESHPLTGRHAEPFAVEGRI